MKARSVEERALELDLEGLLWSVREEEEAGDSRVDIGKCWTAPGTGLGRMLTPEGWRPWSHRLF